MKKTKKIICYGIGKEEIEKLLSEGWKILSAGYSPEVRDGLWAFLIKQVKA